MGTAEPRDKMVRIADNWDTDFTDELFLELAIARMVWALPRWKNFGLVLVEWSGLYIPPRGIQLKGLTSA